MAVSTASVPCLQACEAVEQLAPDIIHIGRAVICHSPQPQLEVLEIRAPVNASEQPISPHVSDLFSTAAAALQNVP